MSLSKILIAIGLIISGIIHGDTCSSSLLQVGENYSWVSLHVAGQPAYEGNLGGVQGYYDYRARNGFYAGAKLAWRQGNTHNSNSNRYLIYVDTQERLGFSSYVLGMECPVTLFTGLGYRYLSHKLTQDNVSSIKFNYNEFYVPLGLSTEFCFCTCWSLGLNFTWMPQIFPTVEIDPLKGANWSLVKTLGNLQLELPISYRYNRCWHFVIKPFFEHWQDGGSTAILTNGQTLGLPNNNYYFGGVELNLAYLF